MKSGAAIAPLNSFLFVQGLETLSLRIERHVANATTVAKWLEARPDVKWVAYPGLESSKWHALQERYLPKGGGSVLAFDVTGGKEGAFAFANALQVIKISNNLGDAKSLITHPATTTHQRIGPEARAESGIGEGMLRLSCGLEDVDDLIEDIGAALACVG